MNWKTMLLCLIFASTVSYGFEWDPDYDTAISSGTQADIIRIFKFAVEFNESNKKMERPGAYHEVSELLELYHGLILMPAYRQCVQILSREDDENLAKEMLKLLVSYENSADEELSTRFGHLYRSNPGLIEKCMRSFDRRGQKELIIHLESAWGLDKDLHQDEVYKQKVQKLKIRLKIKTAAPIGTTIK